MIRHSVAVNRTSAPGSSQATTAAAKLAEKKKEYDAVAALERITNQFVDRINGLTEDCEIMANAGEIHGQVLEQWPKMFEILSLVLASRATKSQDDDELEVNLEGRRLIRIPIDELKQSTERNKEH